MPRHPDAATSAADHADPIRVVQAQLDAYNARDIDGFVRTFAADAVCYDLEALASIVPDPATGALPIPPAAAVRCAGHAGIRARYGEQFRRAPAQRSDVVSRSLIAPRSGPAYVLDLEFITGSVGPDGSASPAFHLVAIYRVARGLIDRAWFTPRA
ncbi:nuclear transport factor 2 family protein [Leptolyngbya sp. 15MV]|nr:nuclear transport factor 2 family protein [Leptolyngbya sp. 15MV]